MSINPDVVIIGAGAAGLSAARELGSLGISYTLIKGSHRLGGRAYSEEIAPQVWFDLGCSYLHQGDANPFVAIADELGVVIGKDQADLFDDDRIAVYKNGLRLDADEHRACYDFRARCRASIHAAAERGEDSAISDLLDLEHEYAPYFMHYMAALNAVDIDETSALVA